MHLLLLLLLLLLSFHGAHSDLNADTQALLTFYNGLILGGRVHWNSNVNVCTWVGVGCSPRQDRVWSLRLPAAGLLGTIAPASLGLLSELRSLSLRSNKLSGILPSDIANCTQLRALYLHHNSFSGPLPSFAPSHHLARIDLSFNHFNGSIPVSYIGFPKLGALLLQNNSLTGALPLLDLPNLSLLNVSYNQFNGTIPPPLLRFLSSSFSGNKFCGSPPFPPCPSTPAAPSVAPSIIPFHKSQKLTTGDIVAIAVASTAAAALLVLILICLLQWCWRRRSSSSSSPTQKLERGLEKTGPSKEEHGSAEDQEKGKLVFCGSNSNTFDLDDLLRASAEVLGKGSVGTAYKAVLEDGSSVVVKRLKDVAAGRKDFEEQMGMIGKMHHKNLVPLIAYYYSKNEKLLVYEYLPMGSLSALLHGSKGSGDTPLDWDTRLKISIGAARGISYVHEHGGSKFSHGNIKSSNVLLDRDYNACISDFGLSPLYSSAVSASRIVGYRAPEVGETRKVTHKSDVYSFGVLLLELLTGKAPMQTSNEEGIDLPRWVQSIVREEWTAEVFDLDLMKYENIEEDMVQMLQVAMACVATMPDQRPKIKEVVRMIEDVRQFSTDDNRQSSSDNSKDSNGQTPSNR